MDEQYKEDLMETVLEKVHNSALKLLTPISVEETYKVIVDEAMDLVKADYGSIFLAKNDELERVYASDPILFSIKPRKRGYTYSVHRTGKPVILPSEQIEEIHPQFGKTKARSDIIVPLKNQNKSMGVLTIQSHQKKFFSRREIAILNLFIPLASLAIRKAQLYDEIKGALETRDLFISMAAHELRTPLTAVNGYVQLLHSKLSGGDNSESRWIEQLYSETRRLTNLVNELLEINRIKSGELNYFWKECRLKEIISRVQSGFKFSYPEREFIYEDKVDGQSDIIIGDYDKILQVLTNLVDNAVKFSPPHTPVTLSLKSKNHNFIVDIKDHGIGIPKEDLDKIFEGYFRGKNNKTMEGMGLGLYIVKDIIHRHHGDIEISSKVSKGTTFRITLPGVDL